MRIAWRDEVLHVVGGPASLDDLLDELGAIADGRAWTPYQRNWASDQKKSTKDKSGMPLAVWQANAEEQTLELFSAHAVPHARVSFNPLLGSGGNAGKRAFSDGWEQAVNALASRPPKTRGRKKTAPKRAARDETKSKKTDDERRRKRDQLKSLLLGDPLTWMLEKLNAASWFSDANKIYNSGQNPFREGLVSPWAMALACEGLPFWAGSASRRLGARTRAQGAFPFVSRAAAPVVEGEAGRDLGEVWVPLWERPTTLPEARALFLRGRAEVGGRGVLTPGAFAAAIVRRGVDAGVSEFRRFSLGRTTSGNTFEPRLQGRFLTKPSTGTRPAATPALAALERALGLFDRLPLDPKVGDRWRFVGLRGPVEAVMLRLAAAPDDPEAALALLDAVVIALDRIDRNKGFRDRRVSWEPYPIKWLPSLFAGGPPPIEARLAMALVSAFPTRQPFALYRFGAELKYWRTGTETRVAFEHPDRPPVRWVWNPGMLPWVLSRVLLRHMLYWESAQTSDEEESGLVRPPLPATTAHVEQWLDGTTDDALLGRWISRLALFDWRAIPSEADGLAPPGNGLREAGGSLCLFGLFQPLFDQRPLRPRGRPPHDELLPPESRARTPGAARALANLIGSGQTDAALRLAASRYAMAGVAIARIGARWAIQDPDRLIASLLFPIATGERTLLIERWLRPRRPQGDEAHA